MNYTRPIGKRDYAYKGFIPFGAGEMFCLDNFVYYDFSGNVVERILADGIGEFVIKDHGTAFLKLPTYSVLFRKEN